jgi:phage terminase Nu1 subunit (DNA packaging protein)
MPTESKGLTRERTRKEAALASLRELQLAQAEGKLVKASEAARAWASAVVRLRQAVLAIPARCAARFADPRHAEALIRAECEAALRHLDGDAGQG